MEKVISKLVALGIPGLVLLIVISTSGLAGGAAIVAALSLIGPGGMIGGVITLGVIALVVDAIAEYGVEAIACGVVEGLLKEGETKDSLLRKIAEYPISSSLKRRLKEIVNKY